MNFVGQRIGRFAVERELGQGMAGSVWLARDPQSLRQVAIKLLHQPLDPSSSRGQRFQREVRALLALRHPAIVPLLEVGVHQGRAFLVLPHFAGGSLEQRLQTGGAFEPRQAARLVARLAEGLELAHAQGILHRDLTPANVLLDGEGQPAIGDFGLARFVHDPGADLTRSGAFYGSPGYLAPEQALGDRTELGVGTDVYGLGGVLYACLTGQPPLPARTLPEALTSAAERVPPPPSSLARGVPAELDRICARCLEKRPANRFPTAAALGASLRGFLAASPRPRLDRRGSSPWLTVA
ncbi:MAG: serine/threonine protein kinase, partial [Planctomycetes bacterium]|nr:serine/threonine protein kinase [Planctomycetota bacterium]